MKWFILLKCNMQKYNILELNEKLLPELQSIAEELGIKKIKALKKNELVYRILDEQAISFAGIQVEKEKEKEAKKIERKTKAKNAVKASEKKVDADKPVDSKSSAGKEVVKTDKKKRTRMEKKDKVEKDIVSVENTPAAVEETPVDTEVMKDKPLLPPVVMETNDEDENLSVCRKLQPHLLWKQMNRNDWYSVIETQNRC